jgi:epoxyqueuosine reductase QueG
MRMSREDWDRWTRGTAIRRAGFRGFKRNVAVAMGNWLAATDEPPAEALEVLRENIHEKSDRVKGARES